MDYITPLGIGGSTVKSIVGRVLQTLRALSPLQPYQIQDLFAGS